MKSLRLRLVLALSLTLCVLWGGVSAWQIALMQRELRTMLDDRLIASARMVASIVHQFQPASQSTPSGASEGEGAGHGAGALWPQAQSALQSVIARDGVACEVSLIRSEVDVLPLARTGDVPGLSHLNGTGFRQITKGGKAWRAYVLEDNGLRVATADRLDVREHLVHTVADTLALPFALALACIVLLAWAISHHGLRPLRRLRDALGRRPPHDPTPVRAGRDIAELAPLVDSLNGLLARMNAAIAHERRWTMDAAHELRTPLTAIKTHVQVAQLALDKGAAPHDALRHAHEGIRHMHATLEQLLQLSRLETAADGAPHAPLTAQQTTQGAAIAQAFALAVRQSCQRALDEGRSAPTIDARTEPEAAQWGTAETKTAATLALPPALLTCAVTNLLDNALRHHQGTAPITAVLRRLPDAVEITVRDHGPGLTPEECALAAQRFWRQSASGPGSGLGLTIALRIAQSAGGTLELAPANPGLQARLRLPFWDSNIEE